MRQILDYIMLFIIFSYLFVGDYYIGNFPAFLLVWFITIIYRIYFKIEISVREFMLQIIMTLVFSPLLLRGAYFGNVYELSIVYAILFINIFPLLVVILSNPRSQRYFFNICLAFMILTLLMYFQGIRSIVFGPNIFYRITGFSYACFYVTSLIHKNIKTNYFVIAFFSTLTTALATQSRGALLLSLIFMVITMGLFLTKSKYKYLFIITFSIFAYFIYSNISTLLSLLGRSAYFDVNNASEATRLDFASYSIDYYNNLSFTEFLIGLSYPNKYFYEEGSYPHNLFIEIFMSFGLIYFLLITLFSLFSILKMNKNERLILLTFFPIYLGSQLSGYFGDHSYLLLVPFIIVLLSKKYSSVFNDKYL